ncbi:MAG: 5-histidylcysteine sulfoxide synthase [Bacteroidota bacterium]
MQLLHQTESLPPVRLSGCTRSELKAYFVNTWELYEWLFSSIRSDDSLYINPDPRRHPLIFYLGHTAVFYLNKFKAAGIISAGINEKYEHLFAVGVDPESAGDLETRDLWPAAEDVRAYRRQVRGRILEIIDTVEIPDRPTWDSPIWSLFMGLEHDRIHFETSSVLIRQYDVDLVERPAGWMYAPTTGVVPELEMVDIPGGTVTMGRPQLSELYGWDNEYGQMKVDVDPFAVSKNMVTNAEFREFVRDGGYQNERYWTTEGWAWRQKYAVVHPSFWISGANGFRYRAMFDEIGLPESWPVEITCHEATAYCAWKGSEWRLLWEREWKLLSNDAPLLHDDVIFDRNSNLNIRYGSPSPVGSISAGATQRGVLDVHGNVWDWLADDFYRLPGFRVHDYYQDFSDPYFDEQHGMLAGGAWASSGTSGSRYYRLWFRRGFLQHAGFRLAQSR